MGMTWASCALGVCGLQVCPHGASCLHTSHRRLCSKCRASAAASNLWPLSSSHHVVTCAQNRQKQPYPDHDGSHSWVVVCYSTSTTILEPHAATPWWLDVPGCRKHGAASASWCESEAASRMKEAARQVVWPMDKKAAGVRSGPGKTVDHSGCGVHCSRCQAQSPQPQWRCSFSHHKASI